MDLLAREKKIKDTLKDVIEDFAPNMLIGDFKKLADSFMKDSGINELLNMACESETLKENQRNCDECAGCTDCLCDYANTRVHAIDEAIQESAKAICIGCGYLKEYKCTYKGGNCSVSKPMLESVTEALEQLKNKDSENLKL